MKTKFYSTTWLALSMCLIQSLYSQTAENLIPIESSKQIRIKLGAQDNTQTKKIMSFTDLQQLAVSMEVQAFKLRQEAKAEPASGNRLIAEAESLEKLATLLQIEALELSGRLNREHFKTNRTEIRALLISSSFDDDVYKPVTRLVDDSERNMKLANEMREEANAERQPGVRLGRLSNADEKEVLALNEQNKAIALLKKNKSLTLGSRH